ncbi:SkfA peptide export ATP-binding protein SkfE [Methylobacterium phyllosphaerae]|uniref:SkfA peptide export ATP-binding protein SkfE n=1 Tax=Methylobacterium phyllosphaerae TaxID=418223 RepID=A0AAE8HVS6_9HYPH|nr:urea ABC transporter ATP-binding subunit UrtE [Methylobacterium phyllosphaerae]APT34734.1 SkfA peptide export ATP-binding protein SkfE [Methylobacterium phyllosphaerae]SFH42399.1 urea transport system ATP-binding protein [Methylobacterium phyllosphaerae]
MTPASQPARLAVEGLDQHYGSAQVLRGIALTVEPGACLAVLGRNGAGKTTLLRCLTGLIPESRGRIALDGTELTRLSPDRRARSGLAYVPQGREIFPDLTVAENLRVAARAHGLERTDAIDEAVALFPALRGLWHRPGGNLSGGQQQQLAIARALATRPRALLLDEPTEGIQPSIVAAIEAVIAGLKGRITVLLVEQYLDFALRVADSVVVLSRGSVVERGDPKVLNPEALTRHIAV